MNDQDFNIRLANQSMLSDVYAFLKSIFLPSLYGSILLSQKELENKVARVNCDIVCMFAREELVATLLVEWHDEYAWVDLFGIHHSYRGRGIQRYILTWLEDECRKRSINRIEFSTLDCMPRLHRFYECYGFVQGEPYMHKGTQFRKFSKFITPLTTCID